MTNSELLPILDKLKNGEINAEQAKKEVSDLIDNRSDDPLVIKLISGMNVLLETMELLAKNK